MQQQQAQPKIIEHLQIIEPPHSVQLQLVQEVVYYSYPENRVMEPFKVTQLFQSP